MNKDARKSLLIARAAALGLVSSVAGLMNVSRGEIREEAQNVKRHEVSDSILDEETEGVTSTLAFDNVTETREKDGETLLSSKERAQLAKDVAARQLAKRLQYAIVLVNRPNDETELNSYRELSNAGNVS